MNIEQEKEEVETTEHELYLSVGLNDPVKPSVFKNYIDNILSENIRVKSWGVHTEAEYIGIIDEQASIISQQSAENERLKHIAGLLASRIDITDEVFDALSMEDDYELYSSKAKKGEES